MEQPIAVFDSGLGGLSGVRELLSVLPGENIVYFGDTARVPYGTRSEDLIRKFAAQDLRFLLENASPKAVLVACGTISSIAMPVLRTMTDLPIFDVIAPTVSAAVKATKNGRIGVLGTSATVKSGAYVRGISALDASFQVTSRACPLFVPLVENGYVGDSPVTELVAKEYISPLQEDGVDTVILGCTHYPLLRPLLQRLFGDGVTLVDSGKEAALALAKELRARGQLSAEKEGICKYYVTDQVADFSRIASMFLDRNMDGQIEKVVIRTDD